VLSNLLVKSLLIIFATTTIDLASFLQPGCYAVALFQDFQLLNSQVLGLQDNISIGLLKNRRKVTTTTHNPQNFNTIVQNSVENDIAFQRQSSKVGADCRIAFSTVGESNELLTLAIEGTKKAIACFKAIFSKVISDFVEVSAGKNVDEVATHVCA
jgi:hypothetical protein